MTTTVDGSHSLPFRSIVSAAEDNIISVLIGLFVLGVVVSWIVGRWTLNVDKGLKQAEDSSAWLKKIHDLIDNYLKNPVRVPGSPILLTERGEKIIDMLKPNDLIENYAQEHLPTVKDKSSYHIQEIAFQFATDKMLERITTDFPQRIKDIEDCAFQHGVSVDQVMDALGVVLRNRILELTNQPIR